jgi:hypothetical protein
MKSKQEPVGDIPQVPFDEALKRMMNTPPKHKEAKKQDKKPK